MGLTATQRGILGQFEAGKIVVIRTDGAIEVAWPWTDDDHRDIEAHVRGSFYPPIAIQVKTTWRFWVHRQSEVIQILFRLAPSRVLNDPAFWYLFGFMDIETMTYRDPLFLVPSKDVHEQAQPRLVGDRWHFTFQASLKPGAHDRWSSYRVPAADLGAAVLQIIRDLEKKDGRRPFHDTESLRERISLPLAGRVGEGVLWLSARKRRTTISKAA